MYCARLPLPGGVSLLKRVLILPLIALVVTSAFAVAPDTGADTTFTFVGRFGGATAVAIGQHHILAANHAGSAGSISFGSDGGGTSYLVDQGSAFRIGTTDLVVYRTIDALPTWAPLVDAPLTFQYSLADASGGGITLSNTGGTPVPLVMVGYGSTGVLNGAGTGYTITGGGGTRRAANGRSDGFGNITFLGSQSAFLSSFLLQNGDGILVSGDSGGGFFVFRNNQWQLAGLNAGATAGSELLFPSNNTLNALSIATDIFTYRSQIVAAVPEPGTMAALGLGALALMRRRKR